MDPGRSSYGLGSRIADLLPSTTPFRLSQNVCLGLYLVMRPHRFCFIHKQCDNSALALDWAAGSFPWSNLHVAVPLGLGCGLLVAFGLYGSPPTPCRPNHHNANFSVIQNGKVATTASWPTFSSRIAPISLFRFSRLLSKAGFSTVLSTLSRLKSY